MRSWKLLRRSFAAPTNARRQLDCGRTFEFAHFRRAGLHGHQTSPIGSLTPLQCALARGEDKFSKAGARNHGNELGSHASTNFIHWTPVRTNSAANGLVTFVENTTRFPRRFYRVQQQ